MAVPDYQNLMLPLLRLCGDGEIHTLPEAVEAFASEFNLTDEERKQRLPSGRMTVLYNRTGWARTYLAKAGLLDSPVRGKFRITRRGEDVLTSSPVKIDAKFLATFKEFREFRDGQPKSLVIQDVARAEAEEERTPEEILEASYQQLREDLVGDLLKQINSETPVFFEKLVVELLLKMGYGGSRLDSGQSIGGPGDEGIDGVINEDRLGLDVIYIQAKLWDRPVGRPEIQKFVGALSGQRARKGVFITSSSFTREAVDYARAIETRVVLLDGRELAQFMIDFDLGVSTTASYHIKQIDTDYFSEV